MVLVVKINKFSQAQMSRQRCSFLTDALHQIAIAADRISVVVHNRMPGPVIARCQPGLSDGHADPVAEPLTERSSRDFDPRCLTALGMPRRFATPLSETFDLRKWQVITG